MTPAYSCHLSNYILIGNVWSDPLEAQLSYRQDLCCFKALPGLITVHRLPAEVHLGSDPGAEPGHTAGTQKCYSVSPRGAGGCG